MRKWVVILLFTAVCGCETIVDLEVPGGYQSRLVVESIFSPDSLWRVEISKSVPLRDITMRSELMVSDAMIAIFGENNFRDTLRQIDYGVYQTAHGHRPEQGSVYRIQVNVDGYPQATASSWAPLLQSELLNVERLAIDDSSATENYKMRFRLADRTGRNYYRLDLFQVAPFCRDETWGGRRIGDDPRDVRDYSRLTFQSSSPSFRDYPEAVDDPTVPDFEDLFWSAFFSDQLFEATTKEFEITFEAMVFESIRPHFMLVLTAYSDDLFVFERSVSLQDLYVGLPNFIHTNPVEVHSNVLSGLGIFAGYTSDTYRFDGDGNEWQEDILGVGADELEPCQ